MATITADTYLDDGTARTAGEAWNCNGGKLTIRTDSRWHANAPASMTGSLGATVISATLGGGILIDGRNVRWLPFDTGSGTVPAIGATITQGGVTGYLLGVWANLTSAPTAVGAAMPATGFIKFREVANGPFAAGALTGISASATGPDVTGWIEVVQDQSTTITVSRKGSGHVTRGDWFYLANTTGAAAQVLQVPTNGGGAGTYCPGVWIETAAGSDVYEFWPELAGSANGWANIHLGQGVPDKRQKYVKGLGSGQMQIGEVVTASPTGYAVTASAVTYTWTNDLVTITFTAHGYTAGQQVYLDFTTGAATDGVYTIETVTGANNFTVVLAGGGTGGNATLYGKTTVTLTGHGLGVGQKVYLTPSTGSLVAGEYEILSTVANSYVIDTPYNAGSGNTSQSLTIGYVPPVGCKVRVPNVFLRQCTTAARATTAQPHATIGSRPSFVTTGAGAIDHEFAMSDWYYSFSQPYSIRLRQFATYDAVGIAECATAIDMYDGGVGMNRALDVATLTLTSCFAGGTIQRWKFLRGNTPGATDHAVTVSLCAGQTFLDCEAGIVQTVRSSGASFNLSQSRNININSCRGINSAGVVMATCTNISVNNYDWVDRVIGVTISTYASYMFTLSAKCNNVKIDGVTEGYGGTIIRNHAYTGMLSVTACDNITFRNAGTRAAPLGYTNRLYDRGVLYASGGNNSGIRIQRCYVTTVRTALVTDANTDKNVLYESLSAPTLSTGLAYTLTVAALNAKVKGCKTPLQVVAANASVYGTHWWDMFTLWFRQVSTYTWATDILTVSFTAHGLVVGDKVYLDFNTGGATADGVYTVKTVTSANAYTVALAGSGTAGSLNAYRWMPTAPANALNNQGRLHLPLNENTAETSAYVTLTGTAQFTSAPALTLPFANDEAIIETQHVIRGHTEFLKSPPILTGVPGSQAFAYTWAANVVTVTLAAHGLVVGDKVYLDATSGGLPNGLYTVASVTSTSVFTINLAGSGTAGNATGYRLLWLKYKINTGSGYGGTWRNLSHSMVDGATTSGSPTITMLSTAGVSAGDYIYGIGVGVDAKVLSVDSATQITATVNSVATGTNLLLQFNNLPNEVIDPAIGFTLKVSFTTETPGSTVVVTYLTIPTITTAAAQDNLYPLDTTTLTLTGLKNPTEVRVYAAGSTTEIGGQETITSGTFTTQIDAGTYPSVDISIISLGYQNTRLLGISVATDTSIPVQQIVDRQYANA